MLRRLVVCLLAAVLAACGKAPASVVIPFAPVFGGQRLECAGSGESLQLSDLRFYVSEIQLITASGELVGLQLETDARWQQPDLALLDFEDGSGACANGTVETNMALRGLATPGDYRGLQFTVGVPFDRNHADPLQAVAPLGDAAMHWHWRGGYKFLRAGIRSTDDGFWIHLGSTGCAGTIQNISSCRAPNRVTVMLEEFVPGRDTVEIDLGALIPAAGLQDGVATDCSSGPAETSCDTPFRSLGLALATEAGVSPQNVFRARNAR